MHHAIYIYSDNQKNSGILGRLWESSFILKQFNNLETQQLCSVNRPISQNKWFYKSLVKLFAFHAERYFIGQDI